MVVVPDGWIDFRFDVSGTKMRVVVWLEVDLGTEEQKQFRRKVASLHTIAMKEEYKKELGVKEITLAFVSEVGEKRQKELTRWIEQELTQRQKTQDADLFLLTSLPQGLLDPQTFFLSPVWAPPFASTLLPLIEL